jgi:hypothetical protein
LPFGRESIESSFSFGFFAEKRKVGKRKKIAVRQGKHGIIFFIWFLFAEKGKVGKRKKGIAVQQPSELLQLNDFAKRLLMIQSKVTLCFCTRNGKKHGIGGVQRGNLLSETDRNRDANFY